MTAIKHTKCVINPFTVRKVAGVLVANCKICKKKIYLGKKK